MWHNLDIRIDGKEYLIEAKVYDNPSMFGINGGRVSKLYIETPDEEEICCYDRGWSSDKPDNEFIQKVLFMVTFGKEGVRPYEKST